MTGGGAARDGGEGSSEVPVVGGGLGRGLWLLVLAVAVLPSIGALGVPLISDDGAILGYVHRHGPLSDWTSAQYRMEIVRFWRPLVTTSWWVQERLTGVHPVPLRLANLACHAAAALLVAALARRLGARPLGAALAGALAGLFPHQGGNVVWIAGRVDTLTVPLVLGATVLALDGKHGRAALVAFLACASKEIGFAVAPWVFLLALGRPGGGLRSAVRSSLPVAGSCAVALVWRRLAIGTWVGGYPLAESALPGPRTLLLLLFHDQLWTLLAVFLVGAFCAVVARDGRGRRFLAAVACALIALLPLGHLLVEGEVDPLHLRTLFLADLGLCLALGLAWDGPERTLPLRHLVPGVLLLLLVGARGFDAVRDVVEWRDAAAEAQDELWLTRRDLAGAVANERPVLGGFSRRHGGAYVLAWGVADRFRAPFELAPRPVWPWRPLFAGTAGLPIPGAPLPRIPAFGFLADPFAQRAALPHELQEGEGGELWLDADSAERVGLSMQLPAGTVGCEALLVTELGYDVAPLPAGRSTFTLAEILRSAGSAELAWVIAQARDVGAEIAYLEVRALGANGEGLGHSEWIPIRWNAEALRPIVRALVADALAAR